MDEQTKANGRKPLTLTLEVTIETYVPAQPVEIDLNPRVGQGGGTAGRCGWFRHDWDEGDDTCGTACCTSTTRYTCRKCGKVKERNNGMG